MNVKAQRSLSLLMLIGFNLYLIWHYEQHPGEFKTLLLMYWFQSIAIGFFTFLLLIISTYFPSNGSIKGGCMPWFFAFHYGVFHIVYIAFIYFKEGAPVDMVFLQLTIGIILLNELMDFFRKFQSTRAGEQSAILLMFLPYLRIVPMHLVLIIAAFTTIHNILIFLILKTLADAAMYLITDVLYFRSK